MAPVELHAELWRAHLVARRAIAARIDPLINGLPPDGLQWGAGVVEYYGVDRRLYEPQPVGRPAIIVPVIEDGDTLDLAAIDMDSEHVGGRAGLGYALGADAIERARHGAAHLHLVQTPLAWLRHQPQAMAGARRFIIACYRSQRGEKAPDIDLTPPDDYAYLFDLHQVVRRLEDVREFTVDGVEFGERVNALFPPSQRHRVLVQL